MSMTNTKVAKAVDKLAKLSVKAKESKDNFEFAKKDFLSKFADKIGETEVFTSDTHSVIKSYVKTGKTYDEEKLIALLTANGLSADDFFVKSVNTKAVEQAIKRGALPKDTMEQIMNFCLSVKVTVK